ncbi:MAG: AsmA-like C-terminal region-containing protein, partial [Candidatus Margulisiibacteriota bacterium]
VDHQAGTKSEIKNANLKIAGVTLAMLKPIDFDFSATANYQGQDIPLSLAGKLDLDLQKEIAKISDLNLKIAGESANLSAHVSSWKAGPTIDFSISSSKLTIDPLLAIFASGQPKAKKKTVRGELTKKINKSMANLSSKLKVRGKLNIKNLSILNFGVEKLDAEISLSRKDLNANIKEIQLYEGTLSGLLNVNLAAPGLAYRAKNLKLENFNAAPFSNAIVEAFLTKLDNYKDLTDKVYGQLSANISLMGGGVEVPDILANLNAEGSLTLKDGKLKRIKTIDAIADKIKAPALKRDINISLLTSKFRFAGQILNITSLDLQSSKLGVKFNGGLDIGNLKYVPDNRLNLRVDPSLIKGLSKEYDLLKDDKGWLEITLELVGSLKKPIPRPILVKPLEKVVGKLKVKIDAKKIEIEEQVKKEADTKKEELKEYIKEEAKKQLKDLIKF